jgi:type IV secretory pathway component VirB8
MNEANKAIAKSINSGQYFIDARRWYLEKFVGLHVEKTFLLIIGGLLSLAAGIAFLYASSISSYTNQISFLSTSSDMDSEYSYIKALPTNISPQEAIENQLITEYISKR